MFLTQIEHVPTVHGMLQKLKLQKELQLCGPFCGHASDLELVSLCGAGHNLLHFAEQPACKLIAVASIFPSADRLHRCNYIDVDDSKKHACLLLSFAKQGRFDRVKLGVRGRNFEVFLPFARGNEPGPRTRACTASVLSAHMARSCAAAARHLQCDGPFKHVSNTM